jgi:hypothetical protein
MRTNETKRQRLKWFKEHPFCYWCGCELVLPTGEQKLKSYLPNMATIDHLRPKGNPERHEENRFHLWRRVLACNECNAKRDREFTARRSLEDLWKGAGQWPRMLKLTGMLNEVE